MRRRVVLVSLAMLFLAPAAAAACIADTGEPDDASGVWSRPIRGGDAFARNFCDDAADWYRLNVCPGRSYTLETSALDTLADTILELYEGDGATLIATDDDGAGGKASRLAFTATGSGTMHVRARQKDGSFGDNRTYTIALTGDTSPCATWAKSFGPSNGGSSATSVRELRDGAIAFAGEGGENGFTDVEVGVASLDGSVRWLETLAAPGNDERHVSVVEASDGSLFVVSGTRTFGQGDVDAWVVHLDASGAILWQRAYGDEEENTPFGAAITPDGGLVVAGHTSITGVDLQGWVFKLDVAGNVVWSWRYGSSVEQFRGVRVAGDGSIWLAGTSYSDDADGDVWLLKLDAAGSSILQETFAAAGGDVGVSLSLTPDGGAIVGGLTGLSAWVIRVGASGAIQWQRALLASWAPYTDLQGVLARGDGTSVAGITLNVPPAGGFWLVDFDAGGTVSWQRTYSGGQGPQEIVEAADGGLVVAAGQGGGGGGPRWLFQRETWVHKLDRDGLASSCGLIANTAETATVTTATTSATHFSKHAFAPTVTVTGATATPLVRPARTQCPCLPPAYTGTLIGHHPTEATYVYFTWDPGSPWFDFLKGSLNQLRATGSFTAAVDAAPAPACFFDSQGDTLAVDPNDDIGPGEGDFYLLRAEPDCPMGHGTFDDGTPSQAGTRDSGIAGSSQACP